MADKYLSKAGLSQLWTRVKAYHDAEVRPLLYADAYGPAGLVSFDGMTGGLPLKKCLTEIRSAQAGDGEPSSSNIRPISGRTGAEITRTGKNLVDQNSMTGANAVISGDKVIASVTNGRYTMVRTSPVRLFPGTTYTLSCRLKVITRASSYSPRLVFRDSDWIIQKSYIVPASFSEGLISVAYTPAAEGVWYLGVMLTGGTTDSAKAEVSQLQLEVGSSRTAYDPYRGDVWEISFPASAGTVYGGILDALKGTLTVTHGQIAGYAGESLPGAWISDRDMYADGASPSMGAQVVYELAEPVTHRLAPCRITSLPGTNHIWCGAGDVSAEYGAFLAALQQEIEATGG